MKPTTEQCLEGAKKHGAVLTVTKIDRYWQGDGGAIFQKDQLTAYTNDMIEQAMADFKRQLTATGTIYESELQNRVRELERFIGDQSYEPKELADEADKLLANANPNPNSAEIARLNAKIEVLQESMNFGERTPHYDVEWILVIVLIVLMEHWL